jgi:heme exporter protein C
VLKGNWFKIVGVVLICYTIIAGFLVPVEPKHILNETIRNLYFHVTIWFALMALVTISVVKSIQYLNTNNIQHDIIANKSIDVSIVFGLIGCATGSFWARFTWDTWWTTDPKLNGTAVSLLFYFAYKILRNSLSEKNNAGKIAAVYNIFCYAMFIVFIMIIPRINDSLHPGNGGNPAFSKYDLSNNMRMVFYPAIIGFTCIGLWILQLLVRIENIQLKKQEI